MYRIFQLKRELARADDQLRYDRSIVRDRCHELLDHGRTRLRSPTTLAGSFATGVWVGLIVPASPLIRRTGGALATGLVNLVVRSIVIPEVAGIIGRSIGRSKLRQRAQRPVASIR